MRRVLVYALIYGAIGASIGVLVALYTSDVEVPSKEVVSRNGSATKPDKTHSSSLNSVQAEVAEPTISESRED
jgi:hypothetical protein